jgi:hypothetical protein
MEVRLIKDLASHGINTVKVLNDILLGSTDIRPYDQLQMYNTDDLVLYFNTLTHKFELLQCKEDGITGVFDPSKWDIYDPLLTNGSLDCGEF